MNAYKITFTDGSHYTTGANGTLKEFTAYLMQFGGVVVDENPVTGKETRRTIEKIEDVTEYSIYIYNRKTGWNAVHPTGGKPYTWTKAEAIRQRESLYPFVFDGIKIDVAGL